MIDPIEKNCDTVAVTGEECLHLISPLPPPMFYFCRFLDLEYQTTSLKYIIVSSLFFFMSSSSCAHAALDFQTCSRNSISCCNLVFLHPVFRHFISDLWSDQSSQDFRYVLEIDNFRYLYSHLILRFDFCLVLDWQQWVWTWSPFCCFFQKQALNLASICPLHHFFIIQTLPGVVLS